MMRSFLQFVGFASTIIWSALLLGTMFTASAQADSPPVIDSGCAECYGCNDKKDGCSYLATGRDCMKNASCTTCSTSGGGANCLLAP